MTQLPEDELAAMPPMKQFEPGTSVLELGNKRNKTGLYRDWYNAQGLEYICLDWNGEDGAVALDMCYSIEPDDVCRAHSHGFDLVTNFGFSEHVDNQMACWSNIHKLVALNGWLAICMPIMPDWAGHGLWMPEVKWYAEFAGLNGYRFSFDKIWERKRRTYVACLQKLECNVFEMPVGMIQASGGKQ